MLSNLLLLPAIGATKIEIVSGETGLHSIPALRAAFGPQSASVSGYLVPIEKLTSDIHGCRPLARPHAPAGGHPWIALVLRGSCPFVQKARAMQKSGAAAIIVADHTYRDRLIRMYDPDAQSKREIRIPALFIRRLHYEQLKRDHGEAIVVRICEEKMGWMDAIFLFVVMPSLMMAVLCAILWTPQTTRISSEVGVLPIVDLQWLPLRLFDPAKDTTQTACAICLEEYEKDDVVRLLQCGHVYHPHCLDPWLTERKASCPLCNAAVSRAGRPSPIPFLPGHPRREEWAGE